MLRRLERGHLIRIIIVQKKITLEKKHEEKHVKNEDILHNDIRQKVLLRTTHLSIKKIRVVDLRRLKELFSNFDQLCKYMKETWKLLDIFIKKVGEN